VSAPPKRIRLLVVSHNYPRRSATGAGLFIHRLNRELSALDFEIDVLQRAEWAPPWPLSEMSREWRESRLYRGDLFDELDGIPIHHPETVHPRPSRFFSPDIWARQVRSLVRFVRRRPRLARADAVMGHFMVPDGYHAARLAKSLGVPSCAMAWGDDVHAWPASNTGWRDKLRTVLRDCDRLVACSHRLAADGAAWGHHPTAWETVYAGTDLESFHPASPEERREARRLVAFAAVPPEAPVLLMIGQPVEAKGYLELLRAWETLCADIPEWHLVMIGANWGNVDVAEQIAARALTGRAHWLGPQAAALIPLLLRGSDALVLPSHNEGLSLSVMEAMATALPVVTTDVGGHREILRHGENGWLIPARNAHALEEALREMLTRPDLRANRGIAARRSIESVGSPEENAARLAVILREMVAAGGARQVTAAASGALR
jgi:glycosyltransferase involved in cell wall biosynthesis